MKSEGLKYFTDTYLTTGALVIFILIFAVCVFYVYRKDSREYFKKMEQLPLE